MTHTYNISGITCTSCQTKVQHLLSKVDGVKKVSMNSAKGSVDIEMSTHISTATLKAALQDYPKYQLSEVIELRVASALLPLKKDFKFKTTS